jgi:hypothetical protein
VRKAQKAPKHVIQRTLGGGVQRLTSIHRLQHSRHSEAFLHTVVTLGLKLSALAEALKQLPLTICQLRSKQQQVARAVTVTWFRPES